MRSVACETDDRRASPRKWSFHSRADEAAIFSHALEITHGCGAAGTDPAGKTVVGVAFGFGVGQGKPWRGFSVNPGFKAAARARNLGSRARERRRRGIRSGGIWVLDATRNLPKAGCVYLIAVHLRTPGTKNAQRRLRSGFWQGT